MSISKVISVSLVLSVVLLISLALNAGSLNPPAPPTAGTMKTLQEVEPRTPIPASATPTSVFTISQSGSYYLTGDRYASGYGITITADNVTVDLNGYSLIGTDSGFVYGIDMSGRKNVEIRNGTIRDFGSYGIAEMNNAEGRNHRILDIRAVSNGEVGIFLWGNGHLVSRCTASENGNHGIQLNDDCTVVFSNVYRNGGSGINVEDQCRITNNIANGNSGNGIFANKHCSVVNNTVCNNNLLDNASQAGILVYYDCRVKDNEASLNKRANIRAENSGNIIEGNQTNDCQAGYGIYFSFPGNFYANNRAQGNGTAFGGSLPILGGDGGGNCSF